MVTRTRLQIYKNVFNKRYHVRVNIFLLDRVCIGQLASLLMKRSKQITLGHPSPTIWYLMFPAQSAALFQSAYSG
jgi:hypothetical protein